MKKRKKTWEEKVEIVCASYNRCKDSHVLAVEFYQNLFFLNPKIKEYFAKTDWEHQHKALQFSLEHLFHFLQDPQSHHRAQILRLAQSHAKTNLNIHPHLYYYWIEALVMTFRKVDTQWFDQLEYYLRECLFFPVSFMISLYHSESD
jgi:hemoglobin-like flavoprotein